MFCPVTVPTECLKVIGIQCDRRVIDVDRIEMHLVVYDLRGNNESPCLAFLTESPDLSEIRITAILPCLCLIKLCLFSLAHKAIQKDVSNMETPLCS